MSHRSINFWLDLVSLLVMLALFYTGFLMKLLLPPGTGHGPDSGPGLTIFGWNRHGWGNLHWWLGTGLLGLMVVHVALHWRWVMHAAKAFVARHEKQNADSSRQGSFILSGALFLLLLVGLTGGALLWAQQSIEGEYIPHDHHHHHAEPSTRNNTPFVISHDDRSICGRMTLEEIERSTHVSSSVIIEKLGLPGDIPTNVKLNQLAEAYGFSIPQVRGIINAVKEE